MKINNERDLINKIEEIHSNDQTQIDAIYSKSNRLLIEAPAGYGKTKTMISKIAYLIASRQLNSNKKILGLSFSVNAAFKIKKDVANKLPMLLNNLDFNINDKLFISNYHGLCRKILNNYGYLLHENFRKANDLGNINDRSYEDLMRLNVGLDNREANLIININEAVKNINNENFRFIQDKWDEYISVVSKKLVSNEYLPYNAIIIFTIHLLQKYEEIKKFYQSYFEIIIVDEFQDTNILSLLLLDNFIRADTQVVFIGDPLQRIYGFIGAIPNLLEKSKRIYRMDAIKLDKNYRFKDNLQMLQLEKNIRANAEDLSNPTILQEASIPLEILNNQREEAVWVANKASELIKGQTSQIAILARSRNKNIDEVIRVFKEKDINYFYGLYTDDDPWYVSFHKECNSKLSEMLQYEKNITKGFLRRYFMEIESLYSGSQNLIVESLLKLLNIFLDRIMTEYSELRNENKINLIIETFNNNALKQNLEYVQESVVVATMHAAKGLEWEYVILPDMEQYVFPSYNGFCGNCNFKLNKTRGLLCKPDFNVFTQKDENQYLEELSVFYVAITRARRQVYFSASKKRINSSGEEKNSKLSCFSLLEGVKIR